MKKLIFIIFSLIIIISIIFITKKINNNKFNYEIDEINDLNYFVFKEESKYGVIDKEGKIILEAKYSDVIIPNPEKDVFVCEELDNIKILNSKKEEIFKEYDEVMPIKLNNIATALSYEKNALSYKKNGLYGLIDYNGEKITDSIYNNIENLQPTEGKFLVKKEEKAGVVDLNGNVLIPIRYDSILSDEYFDEEGYKKSGFIVINTTDDGYKYGYISYNGKKVLDTKYNEINRILGKNEIFLIAAKNGKKGVYKKSKNIIPHEYTSIVYDDNTNLLIVEKNRKYGVMNLNGKIIIDIGYDDIESKGIYIYAKSKDQNKVFDLDGNEINMNFNRTIYETNSENYRISTVLNNDITYYGVIDREGKKIIGEEYRYLEYLWDKYFIASDDTGKLGVINADGQIVLKLQYSSMQKIKNKNIIQAINSENDLTEIYVSTMKKIAEEKELNIHIENDYIIIWNNEETKYFNNDGEEIQDISNLKITDFPEKIGDYSKKQTTIEIVYYEKE